MLNQTLKSKGNSVFLLTLAFCLYGGIMLYADAGNFHLHCPHDVWIDCDDPLYDLDIYGEAYIEYDNEIMPAPEPDVHWHVDQCGGGYIKRKWQVSDPWGKWHKCTQYIHIGSGGVFDENDIDWPENYETDDCNEHTDPDDLPPPYDYPVIHEEECAMIFYSFKDWVFTNGNGGPCKKILRKWKIIDWCVYDPNDYWTEGIWEHTQVIKILNQDPPDLWCPADVTVSAGQDCYVSNAQIPEPELGGECIEGVTITNDSPYAYENGPDASGDYPVGTTKICFTADDGCGNETECCMYVTVEDNKKPTPYCYSGIILTLGMQYDGYYRVCPPHILDKGSVDNCTAQEDLIIWIEPDTFTCADVGQTDVILYVEDESGNVNFCETFVIIQDNMGMCPPPDSLTINGNVHTLKAEMVDEVSIKNMMTEEEVMTLEDGMFSLGGLLAEEDYMVSAFKNTNPLEGVTMEDLATLSDHLFGQNEFDDGYSYIAADINNNEEVNLEDFILLMDLIMGEYDHFSDFSDQTSWRFVRDGYVFGDFTNPWGWDNEMMFQNIQGSMHNKNFIGVKIGDLNEDIYGNIADDQDVALSRSESPIILQNALFASNETFNLDVQIPASTEIAGVDLEMTFNGMEILNASSSQKDLVFKIKGNTIRVLGVTTETQWSDLELNIELRSISEGILSESLSLNHGKVLNQDHTGSELSLRFKGVEVSELHILGSSPNPFSSLTQISFFLPKDGDYTLDITDMNGRTIFTQEAIGIKGYNEVSVSSSLFTTQGVYMATISSRNDQESIKIIYSR